MSQPQQSVGCSARGLFLTKIDVLLFSTSYLSHMMCDTFIDSLIPLLDYDTTSRQFN